MLQLKDFLQNEEEKRFGAVHLFIIGLWSCPSGRSHSDVAIRYSPSVTVLQNFLQLETLSSALEAALIALYQKAYRGLGFGLRILLGAFKNYNLNKEQCI